MRTHCRGSRQLLSFVAVVLTPSVSLAQASAAGDTRLHLLWLWVLLTVALIAVMVLLLFSGPRRRARTQAMDGARRELHGRT